MKLTTNPFKGRKVDLKGATLTEKEKDFLGNLVIEWAFSQICCRILQYAQLNDREVQK